MGSLHPLYPWAWLGHGTNSIFVAVSAFVMRGFDTLWERGMMSFPRPIGYQSDLGLPYYYWGLGFMVWFDLATSPITPDGGLFRFHTSVVLWLAMILLFGRSNWSLTEFNNPANYWALPLGEKILVSFFQISMMQLFCFARIMAGKAVPGQ